MLSRFAAWKISRLCRLVIKSVLLGGEGVTSGGRSDRSMLRFGDWRRDLGEVAGGVEISMAIVAIWCMFAAKVP